MVVGSVLGQGGTYSNSSASFGDSALRPHSLLNRRPISHSTLTYSALEEMYQEAMYGGTAFGKGDAPPKFHALDNPAFWSDAEKVGRVKCKMGSHTPLLIPGRRVTTCHQCNGTGVTASQMWAQCVYCGDGMVDEQATTAMPEIFRDLVPGGSAITMPTMEETQKYGNGTRQ